MVKKALVVVFGGLDRSPRMRYHCKSLASNDYSVTVISNGSGETGNKKCEELNQYKNIKQQLMVENIDFRIYFNTLIAYILKVSWQCLLLLYQLFLAMKPDVIIVQNPPSIPSLQILYFYSRLLRCKLIVDWHNYGYTILSMKLNQNHFMVRAYKYMEFKFGRLASAGFCVSRAMREDLIKNYDIKYPLHVLYDKPDNIFKPLDLEDKHEVFMRMSCSIPEFSSSESCSDESNRFTVKRENVIKFKSDRPLVIISSTSWTADEDFGILFRALELYDRSTKKPRKIVCVITGKGPLKEYWTEEIKKCKMSNVEVILPWFDSHEDYAKMVGSADLGISLHQSSSSVDLPMKIVDMFGCAVPVFAYKYRTITELVKIKVFGQTFTNTEELCKLLINLDIKDLATYRKNIENQFLIDNWINNWNSVARPILDDI